MWCESGTERRKEGERGTGRSILSVRDPPVSAMTSVACVHRGLSRIPTPPAPLGRGVLILDQIHVEIQRSEHGGAADIEDQVGQLRRFNAKLLHRLEYEWPDRRLEMTQSCRLRAIGGFELGLCSALPREKT